MHIETEYHTKLKIKKRQQAAFRRFLKGQSTPVDIRNWIGLNHFETKELLETRMQPSMNWRNYGTHWVIDHIVPFWLFDVTNEADMKLLWHPDNLLPLIWKDNNLKQGDLRFSLLLLTRVKRYSYVIEKLIERVENELKKQEKYLDRIT